MQFFYFLLIYSFDLLCVCVCVCELCVQHIRIIRFIADSASYKFDDERQEQQQQHELTVYLLHSNAKTTSIALNESRLTCICVSFAAMKMAV